MHTYVMDTVNMLSGISNTLGLFNHDITEWEVSKDKVGHSFHAKCVKCNKAFAVTEHENFNYGDYCTPFNSVKPSPVEGC